MQFTTFKKLVAVAALMGAFTAQGASTAPGAPAAQAARADIPQQKQPVMDLTGTLSQDALTTLNAKAAEVKSQTGVQMAVLLVSSLNGETIDAYADRAAQSWHLGDNGAKALLLAVAFTEHGVKLVATRNLSDHIDGNRANDIISTALVPEFRQGHIPQGISKAMDAVEADLNGPAVLFSDTPLVPASAHASATASSAADAQVQVAPVAGSSLLKVLGGDTLAQGLMGSALAMIAVLFIFSRVRSDRALRRSLLRAHVEKAGALQAKGGAGTQRSALDKAVASNPTALTGTLAKSRLAGLREAPAPTQESSNLEQS